MTPGKFTCLSCSLSLIRVMQVSLMNDVCMMHVTNWDERTNGQKAKFLERIKRKNSMN